MFLRYLAFSSLMFSVLCCVDAGVAETNSRASKLFPLPAALKPNVDFWKNVYAVYSEREVIIHDSRDMQRVYEVVNLDSLVKGAKVSNRIAWKKVEQVKKGYARVLMKFSRMGKVDPKKLKGKEKRVAQLFAPKTTSRQFRAASKRIRGQSGLKERFRRGLVRSGRYLVEMREIFREEGVPVELCMLPHCESSFNYNAYSKVGAAGLWQFTRSTGRHFMTVNYSIDERLDPIIATRSAARLLKENYNALGVWPLAITAYNHGRNGMKRAKRKFGTDIAKIVHNYKSRSFGFASRNFYSEFLAALEVASNYELYFGYIEFDRPQRYVEFQLPHYLALKTALDKFDVSVEEFKRFNPALRSPVLKSKRRIPKGYRVRIPHSDNVDPKAVYATISSKFKYDKQVTPDWHRVHAGETLSRIARRYRVSVRELMALNNIRNAHKIFVGQNLQVPTGRGATSSVVVSTAMSSPGKETQLAEADITPKAAGVLDAPQVVRVNPQRPKRSDKNRSAPVRDKPVYVPAKASAGKPAAGKKQELLRQVAVRRLESNTESLEDVMQMALPGHFVEMTKEMRVRVVQEPNLELVQYSFREIAPPQNGQVGIEPDETLGHLADWLNVETYKLRRINHIGAGSSIQIGQQIWLSFENVTPEEFHRRRVEYHEGIEEDFYQNFAIQGERLYRVRPGDNIWLICNRNFELPHWLVRKYNSDRELSNLVAGKELVIPIVEARFPQETLPN